MQGALSRAIPYGKLEVTDEHRRIAVGNVIDPKLLDALCIDIAGMYEDWASDMDDTIIMRMFRYHPRCVVICFDNFA
jgi:hypothetical protein